MENFLLEIQGICANSRFLLSAFPWVHCLHILHIRGGGVKNGKIIRIRAGKNMSLA
jgi:hypothetical protein